MKNQQSGSLPFKGSLSRYYVTSVTFAQGGKQPSSQNTVTGLFLLVGANIGTLVTELTLACMLVPNI